MRRFTWMLLSQNAQVVGVEGNVLTLGFKNAGARDSFAGGGSDEILRQALIDVVGADWKVEAIVDPSAQPGATPRAPVTTPAVEPDGRPRRPTRPPDAPRTGRRRRAAAGRRAERPRRRERASGRVAGPERASRRPARASRSSAPHNDADADADRDDADADDSGLRERSCSQRELGRHRDRGDPARMSCQKDDDDEREPLRWAGGFDMNALLQQAQQMQEQLMAAQARAGRDRRSTAPSAAGW